MFSFNTSIIGEQVSIMMSYNVWGAIATWISSVPNPNPKLSTKELG